MTNPRPNLAEPVQNLQEALDRLKYVATQSSEPFERALAQSTFTAIEEMGYSISMLRSMIADLDRFSLLHRHETGSSYVTTEPVLDQSADGTT